MKYYLKYYFWLFLNVGMWIFLVLNIILFTAGLTGTVAEGSAFQRGNFVNNPSLYIILTILNICFLQILQLDLKGSLKNLGPNLLFVIGAVSVVFFVLFFAGEYPTKNEDKIPTLYIYASTGIFISVATIHKIFEYFVDEEIFNLIKNKITTLFKKA